MKKAIIPILIFLVSTLFFVAACSCDPVETTLIETTAIETNALETFSPGTFIEGSIEDNKEYYSSLQGLAMFGPNKEDVTYPTMDHLEYLFFFEQPAGGSSPTHAVLFDFRP
jgi:hypothetical protein